MLSQTQYLHASDQRSADGDATDPLVLAEYKQISETVREEKEAAAYSGWIELLRPGPNLRRLTLSLCLPAIQQFTGINAITYCKYKIFKVSISPRGLGRRLQGSRCAHNLWECGHQELSLSDTAERRKHNLWYVRAISLLISAHRGKGTITSLTALYTIDRFGRRKTLLTGLAVMTTLWILIGVLLKVYPASDSSASVPHGFIVLFIWAFYRYVFPSRWQLRQVLIENRQHVRHVMGSLRLVGANGSTA